jgi:thymidylate synthase
MARDRKYSRHCGQLKEFDIESDRKFFRVTFRSNDRLDGTGFNATYQFLDEVETYTAKPDKTNGSCAIIGKFSQTTKL